MHALSSITYTKIQNTVILFKSFFFTRPHTTAFLNHALQNVIEPISKNAVFISFLDRCS